MTLATHRRPARQSGYTVGITNTFGTQMLCTSAMLLVVTSDVLIMPSRLQADSSLYGFAIVVAAIVTAAAVDWDSIDRRWEMLLPILDIIAICLFAGTDSGATIVGVLLIFPILWISSFGRFGAIVGPLFASIMLGASSLFHWASAANGKTSNLGLTAHLGISLMLFLTAITIHTAQRRISAQHTLLRGQTNLLEQTLEGSFLQEQAIREVFDTVDFSVVRADLDGRITNVNDATKHMLLELNLSSDLLPNDLPLYQGDGVTPVDIVTFQNVGLTGQSIENELMWLGHPGQLRAALAITCRPLQGSSGASASMVIVARDVTSETNAIRARDDLVASVSHELRTPLTSVLGYLDLARESSAIDDDVRQMLDIAFRNANRLLALVSDFQIAHSRNPDPEIRLFYESCDLSVIAAQSVESVRPLADERVLTFSLDRASSAVISGDPLRLRQVVDNLLSNAIKYNSPGGQVAVKLGHGVTPEGEPAVILRIEDTGRGMTPKEVERIFEKFFRAESVRGGGIHGVGIGLSISREIIDLHGGTIDLESEPGSGTKVTICLPCEPRGTN